MPVSTSIEERVAWVRFGTGERGNAMTADMRTALREALSMVGEDPLVRTVVLEGTGEHFCGGADLHRHHEALTKDPGSVSGSTRQEFSPIIAATSAMPKPVIACLRGITAGAGLGLALAADLRLASPTARFSTAFTAVGLGPDSGVSHFLPRLVGESRAADLLLRPRVVGAEEAARIGLVHEVNDDVGARAQAVARELAGGPTFAYAAVKATLRAGQGTLEEALEVEASWQERAARTHDHLAAVEAFISRTTPTYLGR